MFKIIFGFPLFIIGYVIARSDGLASYSIGCLFAMIGLFILSRGFPKDLGDGIGWAIFGFPIFFLSMQANSFSFLSQFYFSDLNIEIFRIVVCMIGGLTALFTFNK